MSPLRRGTHALGNVFRAKFLTLKFKRKEVY